MYLPQSRLLSFSSSLFVIALLPQGHDFLPRKGRLGYETLTCLEEDDERSGDEPKQQNKQQA